MRALLLIGAALAAVVLGVLAWDAGSNPAVDAPTLVRYAWPEGVGLRYRLAYDATNQTARFEPMNGKALPALTGSFRLDGDWVVRSHGAVPGGTRLGIRLENLSTAKVELLGKDLLPTADAAAEQLMRDEALVDVGDRGQLLALHFADDSGHLFRNLTQLLVSELRIELGTGAEWTTTEKTQHGVAATAYTARDGKIERRRTAYLSLQAETTHWTSTVDGLATAKVEPNGPLLSVTGHESLTAHDASGAERLTASARFSLTLVERFKVEPQAQPPRTVSYAPGQPAVRDDAVEQHMAQRIDGLTPDALLNTLASHARFGKLPNHNEFLWRATALLQRRPDLCDQLVGLFDSGALGQKGQLLTLDLLASAGTPPAQAALRRALDGDVARAASKYGLMYQRVGMLQQPSEETADWAAAHYAAPGPEGIEAAAYTLGSVARHTPDRARALQIGTRLEADLKALHPDDGQAQRTLIFALGNAAQGADTLHEFAQHAHPELRYASAAALRHQRDQSSRDRLVDLTADAEHRVAQRAFRSLNDTDLNARELRALQALVSAGRVKEVAYHSLVNLLTRHLNDPAAVATLRHILKQKLLDNRVKSRIRTLLGGT